jgi:flavodoxin
MNILVAYYSETDNTRKVAEAIFAALTHTRKKLHPVDKAGYLEEFDLVFCGFPVHHHSVPAKMIRFLGEIPQGRKVAMFATHGSLRGGEKAVSAFYAALSLLQGKTVLGTFGCRGQVKPQLIDEWMDSPQHQAWAREAQSANGHPDAADLEDARAFAEAMRYSAEHVLGSGEKI